MIVNAVRTVDKPDFFHKLKGLRAPEAFEQTLFLDGIKTGQKIGCRVVRHFRTFDPVDIQQLIHKRGENRRFGVVGSRPGRRRAGVVVAHAAGVGRFFFVCTIRVPKFFFSRIAAFEAGRQVYTQKLVYRMMVVVNGATLLWIIPVFSTTSNVYGSHKPVGWSCMCLVAKLDKKRGCAKNRSSSHFVPVDIHTLIHSPATPC